ncbi:hypothetical protein [Rhodopseudomonas telluris]|uniref:Uncharacterized protein n=1 Tax=Rhodopseudomonas telluris TaxID=644215 RepID=A0ABV6EW49_9BRAD
MLRTALILSAIAIAATAHAQGVKQASTSGAVRPTGQTAQPSRPTAIRTIPTIALPPGKAIQRTYRDGKLQSSTR